MHDLQILKDGGYGGAGLTKLKLNCVLSSFPEQILELGDTLEELDLSGTGLSSLPASFGTELPSLRVARFSDCKFKTFPNELASCPNLEVVCFRSNGMLEVPEDALPTSLRSLALTGNNIASLPPSIGRCTHLEKGLLAGNQLRGLPVGMAQCTKLRLLRLNSNRLESLPEWLLTLPDLAFLSFTRNPCASPVVNGAKTPFGLASISWTDIEVQDLSERDPSHPASQGLWKQSEHYAEDVAIQLFRGNPTDSGAPADELAARLASGSHESLVTILGQVYEHPDENDSTVPPQAGAYHGGIVTQIIPPCYTPLGHPPSPETYPRDGFPAQEGTELSASCAVSMLTGLAGAAAHLHGRGISHGDLCAHNILASREDEHALLGGFGAATVYGRDHPQGGRIEKVEVLAFAHLVEDMLGLLSAEDAELSIEELKKLHAKCASAEVDSRPTFEEIVEELEGMMGWRGMMRIPTVPVPS